MRDTKALQTARQTEPDPYARRFGAPKWNRSITVTDDHRLFSRLPEFSPWTASHHIAAARTQIMDAIRIRAEWRAAVAAALETYGDGNGILISGIVRDHFPEPVKDTLRTLAHASPVLMDRAFAHWRAAGRTLSTYRQELDRLQGRTTDDRPIGQRT